VAWLSKHASSFKVAIDNASGRYSQLAVQGPRSKEPLKMILSADDQERLNRLSYMEIMRLDRLGEGCLIARTGYTGELGFELYLPNEHGLRVFDALVETASTSSLKPIGLGARDTLRLEACYLLYGNDMNETVTPLEAGIGWAVKLEGSNFIGKDPLVQQKTLGAPRKMIAFRLEDSGVPRHGMNVYRGDELIGSVTSGSVLPTIGGSGGMALVETSSVSIGDQIEIDVRGKRKLARVAKRPLYSARVKD
jgi:aminomethyltransferase